MSKGIGPMTRRELAVTGLHCGGCVNSVRRMLLALDGVQSVDITLGVDAPSTVVVESSRDLSIDEVEATFAADGEFHPASMSSVSALMRKPPSVRHRSAHNQEVCENPRRMSWRTAKPATAIDAVSAGRHWSTREAECPCCSDGEHAETCCSKPMVKVTT